MTGHAGGLRPAALRERIARLPRPRLATIARTGHLTPLEPLPRLSAALGGPEILVKRDDLTGLAFGGNKVRELEFILGGALAQEADVFIAGGGVGQSNHARQCTAAALRAGLRPVLVLRHGPTGTAPVGNLLITHLLGAEIHWVADDPGLEHREAMAATMDRVADTYRQRGHRPYVLYSSLHPLGAVGYVECAVELAEQLGGAAGRPLTIYVTSMGVTQVGLALGVAALGRPWRVVGVGWRPLTAGIPERLAEMADQTAALLGIANPLTAADFATLDFGGPAYGIPSPAALEALVLCARTDALLLDPVYTAKGMAGLIDQVRRRLIGADERVVFVHTGGLPALFAYDAEILAASGFPVDSRRMMNPLATARSSESA